MIIIIALLLLIIVLAVAPEYLGALVYLAGVVIVIAAILAVVGGVAMVKSDLMELALCDMTEMLTAALADKGGRHGTD